VVRNLEPAKGDVV